MSAKVRAGSKGAHGAMPLPQRLWVLQNALFPYIPEHMRVDLLVLYKLWLIQGICFPGEIFNSDDKFIGINYSQGGYPPLTMTLHNGYFIITARSDERLFIEKGGCSKSGIKSAQCPDHPRQQVSFNCLVVGTLSYLCRVAWIIEYIDSSQIFVKSDCVSCLTQELNSKVCQDNFVKPYEVVEIFGCFFAKVWLKKLICRTALLQSTHSVISD